MVKIIVRDGLPDDPIYREGVRCHPMKLFRKLTEVVPLQQAAVAPANAIDITEEKSRLPDC
jgi:hypothetical protein